MPTQAHPLRSNGTENPCFINRSSRCTMVLLKKTNKSVNHRNHSVTFQRQ